MGQGNQNFSNAFVPRNGPMPSANATGDPRVGMGPGGPLQGVGGLAPGVMPMQGGNNPYNSNIVGGDTGGTPGIGRGVVGSPLPGMGPMGNQMPPQAQGQPPMMGGWGPQGQGVMSLLQRLLGGQANMSGMQPPGPNTQHPLNPGANATGDPMNTGAPPPPATPPTAPPPGGLPAWPANAPPRPNPNSPIPMRFGAPAGGFAPAQQSMDNPQFVRVLQNMLAKNNGFTRP